jgi:hypothetical protein
MMKKLLNTIKEHPFCFSFLFFGSLFLLMYKLLYSTSDYEVKSSIRLVGYIAYFILFIGLFSLLLAYKRIILANIVLTILLVLSIEATCFFLLGMPSCYKKVFSVPDLPADHIARNIGNVPYSDSVYTALLVNGKDTVYNVKNTIDSYNKRLTPGHDPLKNKYALFFGCSIAFGTGLNDDQTLPFYFQQQNKEFNAYNYGIPGHGTNHMLARLQYQDLTKQVKEKNGVAFYIFFWDHINRSIGTMDRYCEWLSNAPYYEMKGDQLIRKKMFKDGRYFTSKFYELVYQTNIIKYFKIDFPTKLNENHFELVAEMVNQSKKEYQKQFGNDKFYCVFYPNWVNGTPEQVQQFKDCLSKRNIAYIDLTDFKYTQENTLGGDPHPNAKTSDTLAKLLNERYLNTLK